MNTVNESINKNSDRWIIRDVKAEEYQVIANIYNSNPSFLHRHLGQECIDVNFIFAEAQGMKDLGFKSCVIEGTKLEENDKDEEIIGVLDFKCDNECYLSLMMLAKEYQNKGVGQEIYKFFESSLKEKGCETVRIDVVYDYPENVIPFWEKLGFKSYEKIQLTWGNKTNSAVVMKKSL